VVAPGVKRSHALALAALVFLLTGVALGPVRRWWQNRDVVEIRARMPERGGFSPKALTVPAGTPVRLRLVSDDVVHGFAIGGRDAPVVDLYPGKPVEVTLTFDRPGTYTFYCTRWCGPNHWRMRGTITVEGPVTQESTSPPPPLYVQLGLDIDAPHWAGAVPQERPRASRGQRWASLLPADMQSLAYVRTHTPEEAWRALRALPEMRDLDDQQVWDLVAYLWRQATRREALAEGARLYAQQCAACHGETGRGDGPFAPQHVAMPDFTDPAWSFGASSALWQGKVLRGGMGTTMPSWGLIFTEEQTWAVVDYLWTFSMDLEPGFPAPAP